MHDHFVDADPSSVIMNLFASVDKESSRSLVKLCATSLKHKKIKRKNNSIANLVFAPLPNHQQLHQYIQRFFPNVLSQCNPRYLLDLPSSILSDMPTPVHNHGELLGASLKPKSIPKNREVTGVDRENCYVEGQCLSADLPYKWLHVNKAFGSHK